MTHSIEEISSFVRAQIDSSMHLSGPLSERSLEIIRDRTIKHFNLPEDTKISPIRAFGDASKPNYSDYALSGPYTLDIVVIGDVQITGNITADQATPDKSKISRTTKRNKADSPQASVVLVSNDPESSSESGAGGT